MSNFCSYTFDQFDEIFRNKMNRHLFTKNELKSMCNKKKTSFPTSTCLLFSILIYIPQ